VQRGFVERNVGVEGIVMESSKECFVDIGQDILVEGLGDGLVDGLVYSGNECIVNIALKTVVHRDVDALSNILLELRERSADINELLADCFMD